MYLLRQQNGKRHFLISVGAKLVTDILSVQSADEGQIAFGSFPKLGIWGSEGPRQFSRSSCYKRTVANSKMCS
jgi:hypothetical protein